MIMQKSPMEVFYKKAVLKNLATFIEKHLCRNFRLQACNIIEGTVMQIT